MKASIGLAEFLVRNNRIEEANKKEREEFLLGAIKEEISGANLEYLTDLCEKIKKTNIKFTEILQKVETKGNVSWNASLELNPYRESNNIAMTIPLYNRLEDVICLYDLLAICQFEVENIGPENKPWSSEVKRYEGELVAENSVKFTSTTPSVIQEAKDAIPEYLAQELQKAKSLDASTVYEKCSYIPVWSALGIPNSNGSVHINLTVAILIDDKK